MGIWDLGRDSDGAGVRARRSRYWCGPGKLGKRHKEGGDPMRFTFGEVPLGQPLGIEGRPDLCQGGQLRGCGSGPAERSRFKLGAVAAG